MGVGEAPGVGGRAGKCRGRDRPLRGWPEEAGPVDLDWSMGTEVWGPAMPVTGRVGVRQGAPRGVEGALAFPERAVAKLIAEKRTVVW